MLLWVLILTLFGALVAVFGRTFPPRCGPTCWPCRAWVGAAFFLFILLTSNPFRRLVPAPVRGQRPQPDAAGSRPRDPSAAALSRLCRLLDLLLLRRRGPDRRAHRRRLGALGAAVDAGRLDVPDAAASRWAPTGPITNSAGAAGGSGIRSRTPRFMPWLAGTALLHSAIVMEKRDGAEDLDDPARDPHLLAVAARHLPGALRRADLGARLRDRPDARRLHPVHPGHLHRRLAGAVCAARAGRCSAGRPLPPISREGALVAQQPVPRPRPAPPS